MKRVVHQAFWDVLQEDISKDPPNYEQAIKLLAEIKEVYKIDNPIHYMTLTTYLIAYIKSDFHSYHNVKQSFGLPQTFF